MKFYSYKAQRILREEEEGLPEIKYLCFWSDDLQVYITCTNRQANTAKTSLDDSEMQVFVSEDYVKTSLRENAVSEAKRGKSYKGKPTGYLLLKDVISTERLACALNENGLD